MPMTDILLVDDDRVLLQRYRAILEKHGYGVTVASSVPDAQAALAAHSRGFGCVVTDMNLPDKKEGLQVLRIAHCFDSATPVVIFTGIPCQEDIQEALDLGAFSYRIKGEAHETMRLLNCIGKAVEYASMQRLRERVQRKAQALDQAELRAELLRCKKQLAQTRASLDLMEQHLMRMEQRVQTAPAAPRSRPRANARATAPQGQPETAGGKADEASPAS